MSPKELLLSLKKGHIEHVDHRDVLSLYHVFSGYTLANDSLTPVLDAFAERMPGSFSASGFIKAYLANDDAPSLAFEELFSLLDGPFRAIMPSATNLTAAGFPAAAVGAIRQGRPGLLMFEPTPMCLGMNWIGFVLGASAVDAELGIRQRFEAADFDAWVRIRYQTPNVHWTKVLRIFGGNGSEGLTKFVSLWDEFLGREVRGCLKSFIEPTGST